MKPVPVTLVTGFLGAGKTTLLNHLLRTGARRFAVIENEFGDLNVDGALIDGAREAVFELSDGCVCCSVRDDLVGVFSRIAQGSCDVDHVIIEASGLADPVPVLQIFDVPAIRPRFSLSGVVTVVDAMYIEPSLSETACAVQIACADLLVLNKADGLPEASLVAVEARLRCLNPIARLLRAEHAQIDTEEVLSLGRRRMGAELPRIDAHHHHHHDDAIGSVAVEVEGDVDVQALDHWLGHLVRDQGLLRMKGVLALQGQSRRFVFHGVRRTVEVHPDRPWGDAPRRNRVVFIGRALDPDVLRTGFLACLRGSAEKPDVSPGGASL